MAYKIALASSDGEYIDLHFGEITSVRVYTVNEADGSFSFCEERKITIPKEKNVQEEMGCSCGKGFVNQVSETVKDCVYLLAAKIGNRPYHFLQENNVNCIEAPYSVEEAVTKVNNYFVAHRKREQHVF